MYIVNTRLISMVKVNSDVFNSKILSGVNFIVLSRISFMILTRVHFIILAWVYLMILAGVDFVIMAFNEFIWCDSFGLLRACKSYRVFNDL